VECALKVDSRLNCYRTGEVHPRHLVTCMALREAGERHHDNAGGSRKLSAVAAGHTMVVKEWHYEKVGEGFEQVHESYRKFHPAFVEEWQRKPEKLLF